MRPSRRNNSLKNTWGEFANAIPPNVLRYLFVEYAFGLRRNWGAERHVVLDDAKPRGPRIADRSRIIPYFANTSTTKVLGLATKAVFTANPTIIDELLPRFYLIFVLVWIMVLNALDIVLDAVE